jgi:hypothetical protein
VGIPVKKKSVGVKECIAGKDFMMLMLTLRWPSGEKKLS